MSDCAHPKFAYRSLRFAFLPRCLVHLQYGSAVYIATIAQYTDKIPNGITGQCSAQPEGAGKMSISCDLDVVAVKRIQDGLFHDIESVMIRPSMAYGSQCNDICHKRRNFEYDEPRSESCLGGNEAKPASDWTQT
jgi:hypothetical protein